MKDAAFGVRGGVFAVTSISGGKRPDSRRGVDGVDVLLVLRG